MDSKGWGQEQNLSLQRPTLPFHGTWQLCSLDREEHGQPGSQGTQGTQRAARVTLSSLGLTLLGQIDSYNCTCPKFQNTSQEIVRLPHGKPPLGQQYLLQPTGQQQNGPLGPL